MAGIVEGNHAHPILVGRLVLADRIWNRRLLTVFLLASYGPLFIRCRILGMELLGRMISRPASGIIMIILHRMPDVRVGFENIIPKYFRLTGVDQIPKPRWLSKDDTN